MKNCLIFQPGGLGDSMFIQPIVDKFIKEGYRVHYPILSEYYKYLPSYIKKDGLIWHDESSKDFPMAEKYGEGFEYSDGNNIYVPLEYADVYLRGVPGNIAKYFYTNTPISDYRKHFNVSRDIEKEKSLIDLYNLHGDYIIINENFTMHPYKRNILIESKYKIHYMNWEDDKKNGFTPFDWILALQNAKEIHSVGTSICYIIDKYCNNDMYLYERRWTGMPRNYHADHLMVYRNPNWVYMD